MASRARRLRYRAERVARAKLPPRAIAALRLVRDASRAPDERHRARRSERPRDGREEAQRLTSRPLISIVMPTFRTEDRHLREAIDSVIGQSYPEWELWIVDDGSDDERLQRTLEAYAASDPRIDFVPSPRNEGISAATNRGLAKCRGDFVAFLDHDDTLTPDALLRVAQVLEADPELDVVYSDSDKLTAGGKRADPFLKPDWSPVYALGAMYIGHLLVVRRTVAELVGGFDSAFDKIQDFEFMLRVSERTGRIAHLPQILYHWRAIPGSIAAGAEEKSGVPQLQAQAVSAHLERLGVNAIAEPHPSIPHRAQLARRDNRPTEHVSAVIAAPHGGERLRCLLNSLAAQQPAPVETIVVAGYDADLGDVGEARSRVERLAGPFHSAAAANLGAQAAKGTHLLFLSEDCELVEPDSIDRLLLHLSLPAVGAVGPMLVRPDGLVEEAGVAIGLDEVAAPISHGAPAEGDGYYGSLPCAHEVSAVNGDCVLVRSADLDAARGFNEHYLSQFGDFDLCQRLAALGLRTVYAPRPKVVVRRPPAERRAARDIVDRALFVDTWYDALLTGDPYYNPAFNRERANHVPEDWRERVYVARAGGHQ
jgi:GT2 family glycosyltransferase